MVLNVLPLKMRDSFLQIHNRAQGAEENYLFIWITTVEKPSATSLPRHLGHSQSNQSIWEELNLSSNLESKSKWIYQIYCRFKPIYINIEFPVSAMNLITINLRSGKRSYCHSNIGRLRNGSRSAVIKYFLFYFSFGELSCVHQLRINLNLSNCSHLQISKSR